MTSGQKYRVRFFFDYSAGGCLWAANEKTFKDFGCGPIDKLIAEKTKKISMQTLKQIDNLDAEFSQSINSADPSGPSLWGQKENKAWSKKVDALLHVLKNELADDFEIIDEQIRF